MIKIIKKFKIVLICMGLFFLIFSFLKVKAQNEIAPCGPVGSVCGTATILNTGYIIYFTSSDVNSKISGTNYGTGVSPIGVTYSNSNGFSGYAWSPEYGWINFSNGGGVAYSFENDNENPDWANGQINLSGVSVNHTTGAVSGNATGGNVLGLIDFSTLNVVMDNDLCPTVSGIQTSYPCGPCPNYPLVTNIPTGMIIDSDTLNCIDPNSNPTLDSSTTDGLTTLSWTGANDCTILSNNPSSQTFSNWLSGSPISTSSGSIGLDSVVNTTTVFSINCTGGVIASTVVCVRGTTTPTNVICGKNPHYIEN